MKRISFFLVVMTALSLTVACNKVTYKKAKSGMAYKIFPGKGKDSLMKEGNIVKYHVVYKLNDDSVLFTNYGKAPRFDIVPAQAPPYNVFEIFPMMKKGDSGAVVMMIDTLVKKGAQFDFPVQKGDRIVARLRIVDVFKEDSIARADFNREMEKDRPRAEQEQKEEMAKMKKRMEEQRLKEEEELRKSGELAKEFKEIEDYLAARKITAQKTGRGTYVYIKEQGTGPASANDKYLTIKYTGKLLRTDSTFESNTYPSLRLGSGSVIPGWEEGLLLFKQGGKGTLFIPGFLAYGKNVQIPGSKPYDALIFDVEVISVSDTLAAPPARPPRQ